MSREFDSAVQRALILQPKGIIYCQSDPPLLQFSNRHFATWIELPEPSGDFQINAEVWKAALKDGRRPSFMARSVLDLGRPPPSSRMEHVPELMDMVTLAGFIDPMPNDRTPFEYLHVTPTGIEAGTTYLKGRLDHRCGLPECTIHRDQLWKIPRKTQQVLVHQDQVFLRHGREVRFLRVRDPMPPSINMRSLETYEAEGAGRLEGMEIDSLELGRSWAVEIAGLPPLRRASLEAVSKATRLPATVVVDPAGQLPVRWMRGPLTFDIWPLMKVER